MCGSRTDVGAEDLAEQLQLRLAGGRRRLGDAEDGAVVLAQPDRAVDLEDGVGEIAVVGLDDRQLADPFDQRRVRGDAIGHLLPDAVAELPPARREDLVEQVVAADRLDGGQQPGGQGVVVRREEVLGVGRHVVQVARPADPVADRLAADEVGGLERPELLEDAGPAGPEPLGELVRRARAVEPEAEEEVASEAEGPLAGDRTRPAATVASCVGREWPTVSLIRSG